MNYYDKTTGRKLDLVRDNLEYMSRLIDALGEKIQTKMSHPAQKDAGTQPSKNSSLTGTQHLQTDTRSVGLGDIVEHGDQSKRVQSSRDPMYRMALKLQALVSRLNKDSFSVGYIFNWVIKCCVIFSLSYDCSDCQSGTFLVFVSWFFIYFTC